MSTNRIVPLLERRTDAGILIRVTLVIEGTVSQEIDQVIDELAAKLGLTA